MADQIKQNFDVEAELVKGGMGELSILVNGEKVAKKGWFTTPSDEQILQAVKEALS